MNYSLGEIIEVELAGFWSKGKIIYLENVGSISLDFTWMENAKTKEICVQWLNKEFPLSIISNNDDKSDLADYIQIEDNFGEEIRKTAP